MFVSRIIGSVAKNSLKFVSKTSFINARFNSSITIGVDLGTTNSCVAIMEGSDPRVIVNAEGARTTPSIVAFTEDNQKLVGEAAKRQAISNSKNTIYGTKRLIGRRFKEKEVQDEIPHLPFELCEHSNGDCWVKVKGTSYSPSQIGGMILGKMKETAENYAGLKIKDAVITVPAYFNDSQRQATKDAGAIAGLNVVRIINEPTAAALAYGLNRKTDNKRIAVYDLGGGTFDVSVLEMNEGVFEVKSTNGDTRLGGEDFDNVIIKYLIDQINAKLKTDVKQDLKALQRIKEAAEKAKCELSFSNETEINLPYLIGAQSYSQKISRPQLEKLVSALIQRTIEPCEKALKDANISVKDLDEVILVGGMTRMPKVQSTVKEFFKREPSKSVNPDEAVAMGASIQGGVLSGKVSDIVLVDITPYSLGVLTLGGIFAPVVPRCTAIPTKKSEIFSTSADNQTMIEVSVYQGERTMCNLNTSLGAFMLGPIPPRPKGASQIEVTFEIDSNGIVHVSASDVISNKKAQTTLKSNPRGLSKEELEKIAKESEKERENDMKLKKAIEAKLLCESQCDDLKNLLIRVKEHMESTEFDQYEKEVATMAADAIASPPQTIDFYNDLLKKITECVLKLREIEDKKTSQSQEQKSDTPTEHKNPE